MDGGGTHGHRNDIWWGVMGTHEALRKFFASHDSVLESVDGVVQCGCHASA